MDRRGKRICQTLKCCSVLYGTKEKCVCCLLAIIWEKSILAFQIGEAIALLGKTSIQQLPVKATPTKVLFLDCELSGKQVQMRYTEDGDSIHKI